MKTIFSAVILTSLFAANMNATIARADEVKYLAHPQEALAAFINLAQSAQRSVSIATFIFEPCHASTRVLLDILAAKAKSGVKVRILLDDLEQKSAQKKFLANFAAENGIEIRFYNTVEKNLRSHIKLMVVDGDRYISGGRNISDEYFGISEESNYVDRDLLVQGASAVQAQTSFEELWGARNTSKTAQATAAFAGWNESCAVDESDRMISVRAYLASAGADALARIPQHSCKANFYIDAPDFADIKYGYLRDDVISTADPYMSPMRMKRKRATAAVLKFINAAQFSLRMENWVYMPVYQLADAFANARKKNVRMRVFTNEITEDGPQIFRQAMGFAIRYYSLLHSVGSQKVRRVSGKGSLADRFELSPSVAPFYIHGKVFLRDDRDLLVGSFNLDSRSYNANLESAVVVEDCAGLVADASAGVDQLSAIYEADIANKVPPMPEPSFAAKLIAKFSLILL